MLSTTEGAQRFIAADAENVHILSDVGTYDLQYAHRPLQDGIDHDCDGVAW